MATIPKTYQKKFKTVVFTLHDASTVTVTDTKESMIASAALAQFQHEETVKVVGAENVTYIPFHAIIKAVVTVTAQDITKGDDDFCKPTCEC